MNTASVPWRTGAPTSRTAKLAVVLLIALATPIALYAFAFQLLRIGDPTFHARFDTTPVMAAFHVIGGGSALLAGGFQFNRALRTSRPALHRWLGRFYLLVVLVGAIRGAVVAWLAWVPNLIVAEWLVLRRASE